MKVTAQLNSLRIAPRKVRLVAGLIKGMDVLRAEQQLLFLVKRASNPLSKLLKSSIANAENNFGLVKENLFIKDFIVNEGIKIKRFMPRAMGQAGMIQKKTSRVKIVLEEKMPGLKAPKPVLRPKQEIAVETEAKEKTYGPTKEKKTIMQEPKIFKKGIFDGVKDVSRKFFRRKSV